MSNSDQKVLCVGRLYCDLIFTGAPNLPTAGTETFARGLSMDLGGGAFITAATLHSLGRQTALAAIVPAGPFSQVVRDDPLFAHLDTTRCAQSSEGQDPQITVAITTDDDRAFLSRKSGAALPPMTADQFEGVSHLHIGELSTLVEHPNLIDLARSAKATISLDCGWDAALFDSDTDLAGLISAVDLFLPNEQEYARLLQIGARFGQTPTIVKCGARGAHVLRDGVKKTCVPASPVPVADTTGAGDAFNAGFLHAWLGGESDHACLGKGITCGSANVQFAGGTGALRVPAVKVSA